MSIEVPASGCLEAAPQTRAADQRILQWLESTLPASAFVRSLTIGHHTCEDLEAANVVIDQALQSNPKWLEPLHVALPSR